MQIRQLDTTKRTDVQQFIHFPFDLYRDSELWVPPLVSDMQLVLNRARHPYYQHSEAEFFVAEEQGRTLGRVAVLNNRHYNEHHQSRHALFYYLDVVDDQAVVQGLFDAAAAWARQRGLEDLLGPVVFLAGDAVGLLAEGFEHRPALDMPYNYPYYDTLLKGAGFDKVTDFISGYLPGDHKLEPRFFEIAEKVKEKRGFGVKTFRSKAELKSWIPRIYYIIDQALGHRIEYYPLSEAEVDIVAERLLAAVNLRLTKVVMKEDEPVGFLLAFTDISKGIQRARGRLWPLGWLPVLLEFGRTEWVNFNGMGLLPGHRGVGATAVLYTELAKLGLEKRFRHADIVQVEESNLKSFGDMTAVGVQWYKKHRVYRRGI